MTGRPPVIVIGMHRSGTSLLARLLQDAGIFLGFRQNRNAEPRLIVDINAWLLRQASATWDRPEGLADLLVDDVSHPWLVDYMDGIIRGPAALRFLGPSRFLRYRSLQSYDQPWGFKDPCTTYTLKYWLDIFPQARVIHIMRHGVDVAVSLEKRRERAVAANLDRYGRRRRFYLCHPGAPKRRGLAPQPRCRTLDGSLSLWEAYVERASSHVAALGSQAIQLQYEDLLRAPRTTLDRILSFADVEVEADDFPGKVADLDPKRAHAWTRDEEICEFARANQNRLRRWGYTDIPTE